MASPSEVGEAVEQRPVGVERAARPLRPGDREHRQRLATPVVDQAGGLGDVQVGNTGQLFEADALERLDIRLGLPLRRQPHRPLAGDIGVERTADPREPSMFWRKSPRFPNGFGNEPAESMPAW